MTFGWTDIEEIAIQLAEGHPDVDPTGIAFPQLRQMVEQLDGFEPDPDRRVNEQLLEAVQAAWIEERQDALRDDGEENTDGRGGYAPVNPYR